jgi:hypothetical protein
MTKTISILLTAAVALAGDAALSPAPELRADGYYVKGTDKPFSGTWETRREHDGRCAVTRTTIADGMNGSYERRTCRGNRLMQRGEIHNGHNCGLFTKWDDKGNTVYEAYQRLTIEYDGVRETHITDSLWSSTYRAGPCKNGKLPYAVWRPSDPNDPTSQSDSCEAEPFHPDMRLYRPIKIKAKGRSGYVAVNIDFAKRDDDKGFAALHQKESRYNPYDDKEFSALDPKARRYLIMEREKIQQEAAEMFSRHCSEPAKSTKRLNIACILHPDGSVSGYSITASDGDKINDKAMVAALEQTAGRLKKPKVDVPVRMVLHHLTYRAVEEKQE